MSFLDSFDRFQWIYNSDKVTTGFILLTVVGLATVVVVNAMSRKEKKKCLPPGPRRYPVLGNLVQLKGDEMFYVKLNDMRDTHGDVIYLELGAVKILVLFGHDKVKKVLREQADSFVYRPVWLVEIKTLELSNGKCTSTRMSIMSTEPLDVIQCVKCVLR